MLRRIRHFIARCLFGDKWHYWGDASPMFEALDSQDGQPVGSAAATSLMRRLIDRIELPSQSMFRIMTRV